MLKRDTAFFCPQLILTKLVQLLPRSLGYGIDCMQGAGTYFELIMTGIEPYPKQLATTYAPTDRPINNTHAAQHNTPKDKIDHGTARESTAKYNTMQCNTAHSIVPWLWVSASKASASIARKQTFVRVPYLTVHFLVVVQRFNYGSTAFCTRRIWSYSVGVRPNRPSCAWNSQPVLFVLSVGSFVVGWGHHFS